MNKSEHVPSGTHRAFSWDVALSSPFGAEQQSQDQANTSWQNLSTQEAPKSQEPKTNHVPRIDSDTFEDDPPQANHEESPRAVDEEAPQAPPIEETLRHIDTRPIKERAESYEKYKSLFRRIIGKVARSKGFRKVAKAVATFSLAFALVSCDAGMGISHDSTSVDFVDTIEHSPSTDSSHVDLDNIFTDGQVDLDNIPADGQVDLENIPTEGRVDLENLPQEQDGQTDVEKPSSSHESQETKGIFDGYNKKGMWTSQNKGGAYDFASAVEVAEVCNDDECEMIKYAATNQVECFADYLANLPEALQPEGFKGLTILEAEHKLESLSIDEYESIKEQFNKTIDTAFTRDVVLDGYYHNAYMRLKDPSRSATHDNIELVECITYEGGTKAVELYFTDDGTAHGNIVGGFIIKIFREGGNTIGGCLQVVNAIEEGARVYSDLVTVAENPAPEYEPDSSPDPTPDSTPEQNPDPEPDDTPDEYIESKDPYSLTSIDEDIERDIEEAIGGSDIQSHDDLDKGGLTEQPDSEDYEGTEAEIVESSAASSAESIQDDTGDGYTYAIDLGGAHSDEYAPVQADQEASDAALQSETPISDTYAVGEDISDILSDLGI